MCHWILLSHQQHLSQYQLPFRDNLYLSNTDANKHANTNQNANANYNSHANANSNTDANANSNQYSNTNQNANANAFPYRMQHSRWVMYSGSGHRGRLVYWSKLCLSQCLLRWWLRLSKQKQRPTMYSLFFRKL